MDTNGDGPRYYAGVGQETAPSMTFASEPVTGVYLGNPGGSTSEYVISKRGTKRLRISDTETTVVGPLIADGFIPTGSISLPDGSASAPSLSFTSDSSFGLSYDAKEQAMDFSADGKTVVQLDTTGLTVTGDSSFSGVMSTNQRFVAPPKTTFPINPSYTFSGTTTEQQSGFDFVDDTTPGQKGLWSFYDTTPIMQQNDTKVNIKVPLTCGTNTLTSGAATCSSLQSTGPISWTSFISSSTGSCRAGSGSSSAPSYAFTALSDSGLSCSTSPSTVTMSVGATPVMSFGTSSNSSSVLFISTSIKDTGLTASKLVESGTDSTLISSSVTTSDLMPKSLLFGDGSDGNVMISANTTLTRDMFYDRLTINNSAIINTAGWRIYCKTFLNGNGTGIIQNNGLSASGQTAGSGLSTSTTIFGNRVAGGTGGAINAVGASAAAGTGPGGIGGRGGDSASRAAGTQAQAPNFPNTGYFRNPFIGGVVGSSGGSSGSGGGGSATATGGGGGGGAGRVAVFAAAFTGTSTIVAIQAIGGDGGSASDGTGGVGGGGGGGFVYVVTRDVGSWVAATQINVAGGAQGVTGTTTNAAVSAAGSYLVVTV